MTDRSLMPTVGEATDTGATQGPCPALPLTDTGAIIAELQRRLAPAERNPRHDIGRQWLDLIPRVLAADGLRMSVQTGPSHYCEPRDGYGPWHTVEVGFPSRRIEALLPYIDGADSDPCETVYGHVPLVIVAQAIAEAGGLMPADDGWDLTDDGAGNGTASTTDASQSPGMPSNPLPTPNPQGSETQETM